MKGVLKYQKMKLSDLEYNLAKELIANTPIIPRDHAKLLVLNKKNGKIEHRHFFDLVNILTSNDVLVFNETKVFPARLFAEKIEILLLREEANNMWTAMHRGKVKVSETLKFEGISAKVISKKDYEITIKFLSSRNEVLEFIEKMGNTPIPPYISSKLDEKALRQEYQTVYAKNNGSVAAPTAGLHFTKELIESLKRCGVQIEYLTLHVGAGTFLPIKENDITKHNMHSEYFVLDNETAKRLNEAKNMGKRIISVGTTTTRVLETCADAKTSQLTATSGSTDLIISGETNLFIYPPYKFKFVDSLITNFHLPHSTLLALVSAFVTKPNTKESFVNFTESLIGQAYSEAINSNYRFYSFGDGMIIV